jgi:hypothetical protein
MATTWSRKKVEPNTRVDALAARRVLRDCYRSHNELKQANDGSEWRLRWLTTLTLLRSVGHVLNSIDAKRSPFLKSAIKAAWKRWARAESQHLIFREFIKHERDLVLKEYKLGESLVVPSEGAVTHSVNRPVFFGARLVEQPELVREAIEWWETQLTEIEEEAHVRLREHRMHQPSRRHTRKKRLYLQER